jgi:hypothetical protein
MGVCLDKDSLLGHGTMLAGLDIDRGRTKLSHAVGQVGVIID